MPDSPFNSPLETGLRALTVLNAIYPQASDIQRLMTYDYLLVHSADADGPESLHPGIPQRNGELLVRHALVQNGLYLLLSRNLIERIPEESGIAYRAMDEAQSFLDNLSSDYMRGLRSRADWIAITFGEMTDQELGAFIGQRFAKWTTEFQSLELAGDAI
ncbi:MAG: hypothetical protein PW735_06355 [Acidobacteriaceae bacterium]|nr:hypothetical protein [Acidobacteriaceae bacterium]